MSQRVRGGDRELHGREVLDQYELAVDLGWITPRPSQQPPDPSLAARLAALQGGGGLDG